MFDDNTNTLWCDIAKCGSTTYVFTVFKELYLKAGFKIDVPKMKGQQTAKMTIQVTIVRYEVCNAGRFCLES